MALKMTVAGVSEISNGIWIFELPPHQIRLFGDASNAHGSRSVVLISNCQFDQKNSELEFSVDDISPINVGTTSGVVAVDATYKTKKVFGVGVPFDQRSEAFGPGDRQFLELAKEKLSKEMFGAAGEILAKIRDKSSGDLKRGESNNFSETPDNFWYVIVQPRINELQITIRGSIENFLGLTDLELKDDRGNTRFKVRSRSDVSEALTLIDNAVRRS